jgi:shikimate 5-dehydrogenase
MATVANRTPEQLQSAITVFQKKFSIIKTNKPAITFLKNQLALYIEHTKQGDNFIEVIELLVRKAKDLLEDKAAEDLVGNLGM